ncbi:MAG: CoA pyrophosphatase [Sneathiellaceae bacterium]
MADGQAGPGGARVAGQAATGPVQAAGLSARTIARALDRPPRLDDLPLEIEAFDRGDHMMNPDRAIFASGPLKAAAVLVPLVTYPDALQVLLTHRAKTLARHAGQIAFPGGRVDPEDIDLVACALRETEEEIGLPRDRIEVLGALDPYLTATGYVVAPIVGLVAPGFDLRLDQREVASSFEVPLDFLLDEGNHRQDSGHFQGRERHWWAIPYGEHYIWGATAGMLRNLRERLAG